MTSIPATWMRTPLGGEKPYAARTNPGELVTTSCGMRPSLTMRAAPYTSSRKSSSARTRWATPAATVDHSAPVKIRGNTSRGNGRSSPSRSKVTPWSMKARARREARAETSSGPICASEEATAA